MSEQDFALVFGGLLFAGIAGWLLALPSASLLEEQESKRRGTAPAKQRSSQPSSRLRKSISIS